MMSAKKAKDSGLGQMALEVCIPEERIASLLCTAFEGGLSGSWVKHHRTVLPPSGQRRTIMDTGAAQRAALSGAKYEPKFWPEYDGPLCGGKVILRWVDDGGSQPTPSRSFILDRESIRAGLRVMAERYGQHFGDFMAEREDAITGDVFLQCACLGEVVYG